MSAQLAQALSIYSEVEIADALDAHWQATSYQAVQEAMSWYGVFCDLEQTADESVLWPVYLSGSIRYGAEECGRAIEAILGGESIYLEAYVALGESARSPYGAIDVTAVPLPTDLGKGALPKLSSSPKSGGKKTPGKYLAIERLDGNDAPIGTIAYYYDADSIAQNADELASVALVVRKYEKWQTSSTKLQLYRCQTTVYGINVQTKKYFAKVTAKGTTEAVEGDEPVNNKLYLPCTDVYDDVVEMMTS
ncbi:MAG: hypothetical protein LBR58_08835 [Propionibacteriaceae bacterium]|jgi:hypothetical protein|nr:hypothetical protein [Propionibacteriaceae bacterium]